MFGNKEKLTSVIVLHVGVGQAPVAKTNELMIEAVSALRNSLSLKPEAKVVALPCRDSDSYIETLYIDSNLIGE